MIEVTANLERGSVYFAGETIQCSLRFTNVESLNGTEKPEIIAWASVQIHCFCSVNESRVDIKRSRIVDSGSHVTSFLPQKEEQGHCVIQTPVKILFCDLSLGIGESEVFRFQENVPSDVPPTYRGPSCKYSYKLTVGTQRVGSPTKLLKIPFRVLVLYGLTEYQMNEEQIPSNPFIETARERPDLLDIAPDVLSTITSRKSSKMYKITNSKGLMGVFSLVKTSAKIGEDIVGMFNFTKGTVSCLQYTVCLQSEEILAEECQRSSGQGNAVVSYAKQVEFCLFSDRTHVILPIPLNVTPSFLTDLVCLKWKMHFEFVTSTSPFKGLSIDAGQNGDGMWQGPGQLKTESMSWDVPIQVLPNMPTHAQSIANLPTSLLRF